ncbi:MAG: aspartate ammonia-lyase [Propionibacteriaceae bacterium]|nr:aspartate ammonia-lyase [Propionibacteriaceae bacterium]
MQTRTETDLIGTREVPADAYWGVHTLRAVENFPISGNTTSAKLPDLIRAYAYVKKATALANQECGVLDDTKTEAIVWACDAILNEGRCMDQFPIDVFQGGAGTSMNMNANEVVANLALEHLGKAKGDYAVIHPNDDVNMSQSTNDSYPTAFHVAAYVALNRFADTHLKKLETSFEAKASEFASIMKMGRTQLQDAVPMTVGQEFHGFATIVAQERRHIAAESAGLLAVNLGATAIGTSINTPPGFVAAVVKHLAQVTGLPIVSAEDLVQATSDCGEYVSAQGSLRRLAVKLGKVCNDLRLLGSGPRAGLGELHLPEKAAGSSIMPAKVNPVIPEVVNQVCFKVMGNDVTAMMAAEAGQLQLNAMEPVIISSLFESITLLGNAADTLRINCVDGITVNKEVCEGYVHNSIGLVTFLVPVLGHGVCDEIGKECVASGKSVRQVVEERGLLSNAELDKLLSFDAMTVG